LGLGFGDGLSTAEQEYNPTPIINEIRGYVSAWRNLPNPKQWHVTPETARLLDHWRHHRFEKFQPFFCQIEAVETAIWLAEVASDRAAAGAKIWTHIRGANKEANPELLRMALKLATGAGKTTVMAMLIAWQTVKAARHSGSQKFSRAFLVITPGITIKDRLRVLQPNDPNSYYRERELVPNDMLGDIERAKIVITNYHAFRRRESMDVSKTGRALLQGRGPELNTLETEGQMLQRACGDLMGLKNIVVLSDEAHHCYREKPQAEPGEKLKGEDKEEAKKNNEAARLWISGIETVKRKLGLAAVYDLSATPFFLRGSGYAESTLFPWTVSDFSLMDAIECGIVKLPRVPIADNFPAARCRNSVSYGSMSARRCRRRAAANPASWTRSACRSSCKRHWRRCTVITRRPRPCGREKASACRRSSSWCATTPRPRSSSTTSSPASFAKAMAFLCKAASSCSVITTNMGNVCRVRARC